MLKSVRGHWIWDPRLPRGSEEDMAPCEELLLEIQRDALEAAAHICERYADEKLKEDVPGLFTGAEECSRLVRALIPKE